MQAFDAVKDPAVGQGSIGSELASKARSVQEARTALGTSAPVESVKPVLNAEPVMKDKIAPKAQYGDRGREKRIDVSGMTKTLGSYAKGTDSVPKTGVYKLHKGEAVIPKDKNTMKTDKMKAALSDEDKSKPKKAIKHIETRKTHDGKFVHTHKHHHPEQHPDEEHVSNNMDELKKHMEAHMGGEPDGDEAAGAAPAAPAQMTAQAPPMPAAPAAGAGPQPGM
jgi:hypothetical protein